MSTALRSFVFRAANFLRNFIPRFGPSYFYYRNFVGYIYGGYGSGPIGPPVPPQPPIPIIQEYVQSIWIGHVTPSTVNITAKITNPQINSYRIMWANSPFFSNPNWSDQLTIDQFGLIKYTAAGLMPNATYFIKVVNGNNPNINITGTVIVGSVNTPSLTESNFSFGFGSCSKTCPPNCSDNLSFNTASNGIVYEKIAGRGLNFFIHLGDIHYRDIAINNETLYQDAYDIVFNSPRQNICWRSLPLYYMWDDHDYGPNDSDKNSPSKTAARVAYRRRVPSPSLANPSPTGSPYYSFVRGRVRFIVTDIRSEREPKGAYSSTSSSMQVFSSEQKTWFFNQMLTAKNRNQIIVWVNTKPWISSIGDGKDDWGGYHFARMEIVNFINTNSLADRIVIISGDMHALAYDDGTSINNYGGLKVCHAAPLDETKRPKGGPYKNGPVTLNSVGVYAGQPIFGESSNDQISQYGVIDITDTGTSSISIRFRGIVVDKISGNEGAAIDVIFNLNAGGPPLPSLQPHTQLNTIATYLRNYITTDLRNTGFFNYSLDGNDIAIGDGGFDMFDVGNFTMPWLLSNDNYTNSNDVSSPPALSYNNTTSVITDTNFHYVSLGYSGISPERRPLTLLGSRSVDGVPVGFQKAGNIGADGGGSLISGDVYNGENINGFTVYAYYRQTYNNFDPTICDLYMLLGHDNWDSNFGTILKQSYPFTTLQGAYFYTTGATKNILAITTLLSREASLEIPLLELQSIVTKYTQRIKEALNY